MYRIYEIKNGDTLDSIARKLNITADVLAALNGINPSTFLTPGTYIVVPNGESMFEKYVVKKGDNPYQIASLYNVSEDQLLKLNGLNKSDYIYPDEVLLVPRKGTSFYVTEDGDTFNDVLKTLNKSADEIASQNSTLYLLPDQLIITR